MTATLISDSLISLNQPRWSCVIDPLLTLSDFGLPLVKQLGELMNLWVVREFWHILDNTHLYIQQPELMFGSIASENRQPHLSQQAIRALREWEQIRMATDLSSLNLFWIGDALGASFLPNGTDAAIVWRWESLAQSLDRQQNASLSTTLAAAYRDAAALVAALGSACILTYQIAEDQERHLAPGICTALESWGVPCRPIAATDPLAAIERNQFRRLLVASGLSKLLWAGLQLSILHLVVPAAASLNLPPSDWSQEFLPEDLLDSPELETNLWEGAQGFWYSI